MRSQHPQSDADDRLSKMVAAILVLSIGFWLYKQYGPALAASNPQPANYVVQPSVAEIRLARCQAAKDHRDDVLRQAGLNRTFDLLRQLDDQVYEACKTQ